MSVEPKVYYDHERALYVGPLGCWDLGDEFDYRGGRWAVVNVQPDGMAVAMAPDAKPSRAGRSLASVLRGLDSGEASGPVIFTTRGYGMAAKIRADRERHGLPVIETKVAA